MHEEPRRPCTMHPTDIGAGEQSAPEFLSIAPDNRAPAIVDSDDPRGKSISLFKASAILLYLAGKTGRFLSRSDRGRLQVFEWLMWQVGGFSPMLGQAHQSSVYVPQRAPYAFERNTSEAQRFFCATHRAER